MSGREDLNTASDAAESIKKHVTMRFFGFLSIAACCVLVSAAPAPSNHRLHEKRNGHPHEWTKRSRAHGHKILPIRIGLQQRNLHLADEFIMDISDPASPNFGKHWSAEKIANTFAPSREATDTVTNWLLDSGIDASRLTYSTGGCQENVFMDSC